MLAKRERERETSFFRQRSHLRGRLRSKALVTVRFESIVCTFFRNVTPRLQKKGPKKRKREREREGESQREAE